MFETVLVADRGERAVLLVRACQQLGLKAVVAYSDDDDAAAPHVVAADEPVLIGGPEGYADVRCVVEAARQTGAQAVHPGAGPLAGDPAAARAVLGAGLVWIGPGPEVLDRLADLRTLAAAADLPVSPGPAQDELVVLVDEAGEAGVLGAGDRGVRPGNVAAARRVGRVAAGAAPVLITVGLADGPSLVHVRPAWPTGIAGVEQQLRVAGAHRPERG